MWDASKAEMKQTGKFGWTWEGGNRRAFLRIWLEWGPYAAENKTALSCDSSSWIGIRQSRYDDKLATNTSSDATSVSQWFTVLSWQKITVAESLIRSQRPTSAEQVWSFHTTQICYGSASRLFSITPCVEKFSGVTALHSTAGFKLVMHTGVGRPQEKKDIIQDQMQSIAVKIDETAIERIYH